MRNSVSIIAIAVLSAACSKAPATAPAETAPAVAAEAQSAPSPEAETEASLQAAAVDPLTDRIWLLNPDGGRLGAMRLFLGDGVMMQGSCGETYRLSQWRRDEVGKIQWNEDGLDISAELTALDPGALTISINLVGGEQKVESYTPAAAPFVCPDLPR